MSKDDRLDLIQGLLENQLNNKLKILEENETHFDSSLKEFKEANEEINGIDKS